MMMAVANNLPKLENRREFKDARNSVVYAADGRTKIATLTGNSHRILVGSSDISPAMKQATVAIEDRRFYEHHGVDYQGIARALSQDILRQRAAQGGSTITQQFVKNALASQRNRTIFQKLREVALAYHLERKWSKDKILTEYLNAIYFGEGAYGIESAARTYFGSFHPGCGGPGNRCASVLLPHEAAMLAGLIASPSRFSPRQNPQSATDRRNLVLRKMYDSDELSATEYRDAVHEAVPGASDIHAPREESKAPYFTAWMREQLVQRYGAGQAFGGGLKIYTGINLGLQQAVEQAVTRRLGGVGPTAAVVVLDNKTAEIRAMVGGPNFDKQPFNLAVDGHRQPGSAFKPFVLVTALEKGIGPGSVWTSKKKQFTVPNSAGKEKFVVSNYEDQYFGVENLATATARSDNSVFAELGFRVGFRNIKRTAQDMGIVTPVSTNPAMTLGGLKKGLSVIELAHAYETLARGGRRITGSLAPDPGSPVAISRVVDAHGKKIASNHPRATRVIPKGVATTATQLLQGVIARGTGKRAAYGGFAAGKTGTTENYGDAWFVGFTKNVTVAVWVGYPNSNKPMLTEFGGAPVAGGTYPALIWHDVVTAWENILARQKQSAAARRAAKEAAKNPTTPAPAPSAAPAPTPTTAPEKKPSKGGTADQGAGPTPAQPPPSPQGGGQAAPAPADAPPGNRFKP
jgi:penicillin-binding protein 1A